MLAEEASQYVICIQFLSMSVMLYPLQEIPSNTLTAAHGSLHSGAENPHHPDDSSFGLMQDSIDLNFPDSLMNVNTAFISTPIHSPKGSESNKSCDTCLDRQSPPFSPVSQEEEAFSFHNEAGCNDESQFSVVTEPEAAIQGCSCADPLSTDSNPDAKMYGMKLVADNIDKTVKPRYMRIDKRNSSMHFMHVYAVRDRISMHNISETPPEVPDKPALEDVLPSKEDDCELLKVFGIHVSRILSTYMPFFRENFRDVVTWHISHKFSEEMSKKSDVVSVYMLEGTYKSDVYHNYFTGSLGCPSER